MMSKLFTILNELMNMREGNPVEFDKVYQNITNQKYTGNLQDIHPDYLLDDNFDFLKQLIKIKMTRPNVEKEFEKIVYSSDYTFPVPSLINEVAPTWYKLPEEEQGILYYGMPDYIEQHVDTTSWDEILKYIKENPKTICTYFLNILATKGCFEIQRYKYPTLQRAGAGSWAWYQKTKLVYTIVEVLQ